MNEFILQANSGDRNTRGTWQTKMEQKGEALGTERKTTGGWRSQLFSFLLRYKL